MSVAETDDLTQLFRQESGAILDALSSTLLRLEREAGDVDARNEALRHFHTLKGMANMEGHPELARLCHEAEARLADGDDAPIDPLLRRIDEMRAWLQQHGLGVEKGAESPGGAYVSVQTERLDTLLNLVGELSVVNTRLLYEDQVGDSSGETLRALTALVRNLQEEVMKARLLPARTLFAGLPRLVRDAAKARGIEVDLVLDESNIGLDRGIVDHFSGVLAHLVQNSIAHGIEPPDARVAAGKPARGTIRVALQRDQETVAITLEDDGRGLDQAAIKAQAMTRGLWSPEQAAQAGATDLAEVIFSPGFSTSSSADRHAGRGIGLTAVRQTVRELGGTLRIDSADGDGMRTTIQLPPSVALLETLVARAAGTTIALPLRNIRRIHSAGDAVLVGGRRMLVDPSRAIPLLGLEGGPAGDGEGRFAVVLEATRGTFALVVDDLLGTHATILKPLDASILEAHGNAMGAAVLGSGTLAIVLDPNQYHGKVST